MKQLIFVFLAFNFFTLWSFGMDDKKSVYDFNVKDINGNETVLNDYSGKVILMVNVASKCGYTYQYEGLEKIYEKYKDKGFVILGFPTNNFLGQEPGTNEQIKEFCTLTYGVSFPMFSKISVKGKEKEPLYLFLTDKKTNPQFGGEITWNFNKFLIGKNGEIVNRFDTKVNPDDPKIISSIESELKK
jgi:glutathione peroxidase